MPIGGAEFFLRQRQQFPFFQHQVAPGSVEIAPGGSLEIGKAGIARATIGIKRRITLKISSYLGAALVVEHTDLIVTVPNRLGEVLRNRGAYRVFPVPFSLPDYEVKQLWHERYHNDPGNRWLRGVISELLSEVKAA
jgi:DNA-binding transcriptional LysR family regulator